MRFERFREAVAKFPFFSIQQIAGFSQDRKLLLNQLSQWQGQGRILRLKRGLYMLGTQECRMPVSKLLIANQLISPSYVSTDYALSFYGLIPEKTEELTCVTPRKTSLFQNGMGVFRYQHVKPNCFTGFIASEDENHFPIWLAEPEKALVDFFYLNLSSIPKYSKDVFVEFYRFQNMENLNQRKLAQYTELFHTKKLKKIIRLFIEFLREYRKGK